MHKVIEAIKKIRTKSNLPFFADIEKYLETGDKRVLPKITTTTGGNWSNYAGWSTFGGSLSSLLSLENPDDEVQLRLLDILVKLEAWKTVISDPLKNEKEEQDLFPFIHGAFLRCGKNEAQTAIEFWNCGCYFNAVNKPNSGTKFYLAMDEKEFMKLVAMFPYEGANLNLTRFLLQHEPDRIDGLLDCLVLFKPQRYFPEIKLKTYTFMTNSAVAIMEKTGTKYAKRIREIWETIGLGAKVSSGIKMMKICPDVFLEPTKKAVLEYTKTLDRYPVWVHCFLLRHFGKEFLPPVLAFFKDPKSNMWESDELFSTALEVFGTDALCVFDEVKEHPNQMVRFIALRRLLSTTIPEFDAAIEERFHAEFAKNEETLELLRLAKKWKPERFTETFWKLLGNKSKPVRETAARTLGEIGEIDLDRVAKLLVDKKADNRDSAVNILAQLKTDQSIKLLESRLDEEENDDIRDKILVALESAWEAKGKKITMKTIEQRIERAAAKIEKFEIQWLKFDKLPPLMVGKKKLDEKTVRYLLYRQSRCKEMRADVEAKPLLAMIDRKTSGDFALFVLNAFLNSKMDAADRWALAVAGLLGDDRIVPILSKQIQIWADCARGKMSEYAVQSLALLGTETALTVVNAMTIRYRTKYKNIGTSAAAAFELVAEQRGITADELGDRVVPMLGFEPGKPKLWSFGDKNFEVRIGMDFKVSIYDTEKKKSVAALPKSAPKEVAEELKEIKDALKEVVKGQLLRIENMLVRQYRWPIGGSDCGQGARVPYLQHPVLRPFTVRLVWGVYDEKGKLKTTFRALEDGSLTDADDETVTLPKTGKIGIVHPLELTEQQRNAWRQHLLDFEIVQPFPQLERSVVVATDEEKTQTVSTKWFGTQLNAMTFKSRSEKLGWRRGSVCDAGWIPMYWKSFPEAGADVFLGLDNFYIGIGVEEEVTLQNLCFVKTGSVQIGSYVYDDPDTDKGDDRIIPFGKVSSIVFSEAIGDMNKIAPAPK